MKRSAKFRLITFTLAMILFPLWPLAFLFCIGCLLVYGLNNPGPKWLLDFSDRLFDDL